MNVFNMTKEDFEKVPERGGWSRDIGEFNSLIIIPQDYAHDSTEDCYWFLVNEGLIGKPEQPEAPELSEAPVYYEMYFTEEDVAAVAKMLWGEARGCTRDNQIKCAWVVVNRVDDERFPDTIQGVLSQPSQFHGYSESFPVTDELYSVAFDVLTRWSYEKQGIPVSRELAKSYLYFTGNGVENIFREVY